MSSDNSDAASAAQHGDGAERPVGQSPADPAYPDTAHHHAASDEAAFDRAASDEAASHDAAVRSLPSAIALYTVLRVGLIAVLTVVLMLAGAPFGLPLIVALLFAIVLQLPLSVLLFPRQRRNLTAALARAKSERTAERDRLRSALTGEDPQD